MKLWCFCLALILSSALVAAQERQQKTQTKVTVADGKMVTVTGCVRRAPDGGFQLTNVAGKDGELGSYILSADDDDRLSDHVGERVEITGRAADLGKGKLKLETKTETKVEGGDKTKTESKSEVKGDLKGLPFLGVKSVRTIASVCP